MTDVSPKPEAAEVYLGDGLYASFDGYQICLRAPVGSVNQVVYLEPAVFRAFIKTAQGWGFKP